MEPKNRNYIFFWTTTNKVRVRRTKSQCNVAISDKVITGTGNQNYEFFVGTNKILLYLLKDLTPWTTTNKDQIRTKVQYNVAVGDKAITGIEPETKIMAFFSTKKNPQRPNDLDYN